MLNLLLLSLLSSQAANGYQWPSPQYDALEDFLYEGMRPDGSSMADLVRPCKMRGGTNTTVAAEWVRLVYHDTATHNIADGSGGLDGSIFFETSREENIGSGMTNTLSDFETYPSKYISRADIISIGTVWAVATCGGPVIPLRGGRIDANAAGPFGVPNATDSVESLTSTFAHQGYNVSEMIQLVACGHTLGGVRSSDFPTAVAPGPNPNSPVFGLFDETQQFDNAIVTKYLDGTTQNPLIVGNQSMASDRRVFGADNNATLQSMSSADAFSKTCATIFDKMLNTVPSTVTLTDTIDLIPVKVSQVQLTVGPTSQLQFQASVRISLPNNGTSTGTSTTTGSGASTSATVTMYWCDRYGKNAACAGNVQRFSAPASPFPLAVSSPTSEALGLVLKKYQFVVPIDPAQSVSKFWFVVDYGNGKTQVADNGGSGYVVEQDEVLFVSSKSKAKSVLTGQSGVDIVAGVKNTTTPSRVYISCFGRATANYLPVNQTYDLTLNSSIPSVAGYNFYTGTASDEFGATMQFDVVLEGSAQSGSGKRRREEEGMEDEAVESQSEWDEEGEDEDAFRKRLDGDGDVSRKPNRKRNAAEGHNRRATSGSGRWVDADKQATLIGVSIPPETAVNTTTAGSVPNGGGVTGKSAAGKVSVRWALEWTLLALALGAYYSF